MTDDETGVYGAEFPRYPRILVAVDESPVAAFVLRHVVPFALQQRSRLTLVTVVPRTSSVVVAAGMSPQELDTQIETQAAAGLRRLASALPQDCSVTTLLRRGDPAHEILALLRDDAFDLLCMGARGRGRASAALLGSVSGEVLHHSPVPVFVLHPPAPGA